LLADAQAGKLSHRTDDAVAEALTANQRRVVSFGGWQRIDRTERQAGSARGRPRIKQTDIGELLASAAR
jgi:ferredoxin--NADP+ reductase